MINDDGGDSPAAPVILGKGAEARGANVGSETSLSASARSATQEILEPLLEPLPLLGLQRLDRSPDGREVLLDLDDDLLRRR